MKRLLIILLLVLVACTAPPESIPKAKMDNYSMTNQLSEDLVAKPINTSESFFEFTGYSSTNTLGGDFDKKSGYLFFKDNQLVGFNGTIDPASVNTSIKRLDDHLKNEDFFHVEKYTVIKFETVSFNDSQAQGELTFHGETKNVSFPVNVTKNRVSADFLLDTHRFGMKRDGINKNVRIQFSLTD